MAYANHQLGEPITAGTVLVAASKAKAFYNSLKDQFGLDSSMNKMSVVNRVGRTTKKTKLCRRADWSCLSMFNVYPGEKLQVLAQSPNWAYVRNSDGIAGYVPLTDLRISWTEVVDPNLEEKTAAGSSPTIEYDADFTPYRPPGSGFFDDVQVKPPPAQPPPKLGMGALAVGAVAAYLLLS
jgi:hypothetical protein